MHPKFPPVFRHVPKPITINHMVLLYVSSEIPVTLKASRKPLLGPDTLQKLTHLSLHCTSPQTLLEASSDWNPFYWWTVIWGAPRLVAGGPSIMFGTPRHSQIHSLLTPVLWDVPKRISRTPIQHIYQWSAILVTVKAGWNSLLGSDTLLKLTHLCLHFISSQTLLEISSD